ncbi:MAG: FGGY family carbohydrate kinase [Propionicimonas sp.]|nr:FGGY family carbohydrate kinase [Propionicimonas sp.]
MTDLVLGIDVGTSGAKSLLVDGNGTVLASAVHHYPTSRTTTGQVEQDAAGWWDGVVAAVRDTLTGIDPARVSALALSAQGGALVCADSEGRPLAPARSWLDNRAVDAAAELAARFGAHGFYERTGWRLGPRYNAAQLADLRATEPDLFGRTACFLDTAGFITRRLTGKVATDLNSSGITQLLDAAGQCYDPEILDALGITTDRLPTLVPTGTVIGPLTAAAADALGLPAGVLVVAGAHDQYCAAVGAGAIDEETVLLSAGTAWVVLGSAAHPIADRQENFAFGSHAVPGLWGQFGSLLNGGSSLEWVRRLWGTDGVPLGFDQVNQDAAQVSAGADGLLFLPHFGGTVPDWNDASRGSFVGVDLIHERKHFLRATLEGIGAEAAALLSLHRRLNPAARRVRLIGGATRSPIWPQILADLANVPIELPAVADAACLGAAVIAAAGDPARIAETSRRMVGEVAVREPGPDRDRYADQATVRQAFAEVLSATYGTTATPPRS